MYHLFFFATCVEFCSDWNLHLVVVPSTTATFVEKHSFVTKTKVREFPAFCSDSRITEMQSCKFTFGDHWPLSRKLTAAAHFFPFFDRFYMAHQTRYCKVVDKRKKRAVAPPKCRTFQLTKNCINTIALFHGIVHLWHYKCLILLVQFQKRDKNVTFFSTFQRLCW